MYATPIYGRDRSCQTICSADTASVQLYAHTDDALSDIKLSHGDPEFTYMTLGMVVDDAEMLEINWCSIKTWV